MKFLKYIIIFFIFAGLAFPMHSTAVEKGDKKSIRKSTFSKKGNFRKDDTFNKEGTRAFGPPDPDDGSGGNPVPVDPAYGLLILAGLSYTFFLIKKKKK